MAHERRVTRPLPPPQAFVDANDHLLSMEDPDRALVLVGLYLSTTGVFAWDETERFVTFMETAHTQHDSNKEPTKKYKHERLSREIDLDFGLMRTDRTELHELQRRLRASQQFSQNGEYAGVIAEADSLIESYLRETDTRNIPELVLPYAKWSVIIAALAIAASLVTSRITPRKPNLMTVLYNGVAIASDVGRNLHAVLPSDCVWGCAAQPSHDASRIASTGRNNDGSYALSVRSLGSATETQSLIGDNPISLILHTWLPDNEGVVIAERTGDYSAGRGENNYFAVALDTGAVEPLRFPENWHIHQLRWSPDGKYLAIVASGINDLGKQFILIQETATGAFLPQQYDAPLTGKSIDWSPDSTRLVYVKTDGRDTEIMQARIGADAQSLTNNNTIDTEPAWSADGQWIAFASLVDGGREIFVVSADGKNTHQITNQQFHSIDKISVSPDGNTIAVIAGVHEGKELKPRVFLIDVADGTTQLLKPDAQKVRVMNVFWRE